jgi:hypothetical protein
MGQAVRSSLRDLNMLFKKMGITVVLVAGSGAPTITVAADPSIRGGLHGDGAADIEAGRYRGGKVRLPIKVEFNTPGNVLKPAGLGIREVIAAHEDGDQLSLPVSSKGQAGADVLLREIWEIL